MDDAIGDHGREEALELELRDKLLRCGVAGRGGCSEYPIDLTNGRLGGLVFIID